MGYEYELTVRHPEVETFKKLFHSIFDAAAFIEKFSGEHANAEYELHRVLK